eukprot:CAMPEP_0205799038 /NCGR_PEP_ID=MMETSP0205-20121125/154_1 /ASSEMBLY_ACC=CAM_ASM_000278 /TAXON_ID=36767 /ORGANISM="Euplotes focardii, Strain TN1" /LENGTH=105 /DNA_ID=CAMNT_0053059641 /DNA_START=12 /DNA_END=329 /DNA_ORIENTATION=+
MKEDKENSPIKQNKTNKIPSDKEKLCENLNEEEKVSINEVKKKLTKEEEQKKLSNEEEQKKIIEDLIAQGNSIFSIMKLIRDPTVLRNYIPSENAPISPSDISIK